MSSDNKWHLQFLAAWIGIFLIGCVYIFGIGDKEPETDSITVYRKPLQVCPIGKYVLLQIEINVTPAVMADILKLQDSTTKE